MSDTILIGFCALLMIGFAACVVALLVDRARDNSEDEDEDEE